MKKRRVLLLIVLFFLFFFLMFTLTSCTPPEDRKFTNVWEKEGYKKGDMVYLKPDSVKATIKYVSDWTHTVNVVYFDKMGRRQYLTYIDLHEIY